MTMQLLFNYLIYIFTIINIYLLLILIFKDLFIQTRTIYKNKIEKLLVLLILIFITIFFLDLLILIFNFLTSLNTFYIVKSLSLL